MDNITAEIVPLAFLALIGFIAWGFGYMVLSDMEDSMEDSARRYEICITANKQWIDGNCINE